jgi:hypothetical protein
VKTSQEKVTDLFRDYSAEEVAAKIRELTNLKAFQAHDLIAHVQDDTLLAGIVENALDEIHRRLVG